MKITIKKVKNYDYGMGVIRDTYFCNIWDKYGNLERITLGGFTKEEALKTKNNIKSIGI